MIRQRVQTRTRPTLVPGLERSDRLTGSLSHVLTEEFGLSPTRSESECSGVNCTEYPTPLTSMTAPVPYRSSTVPRRLEITCSA